MSRFYSERLQPIADRTGGTVGEMAVESYRAGYEDGTAAVRTAVRTWLSQQSLEASPAAPEPTIFTDRRVPVGPCDDSITVTMCRTCGAQVLNVHSHEAWHRDNGR